MVYSGGGLRYYFLSSKLSPIGVPSSSSTSQALTRESPFADLFSYQPDNMGDYTIQITPKLINQLAQGNEKPKRKAKRTKPKVSPPPQNNADQARTHRDAAEKPKPVAELPTQQPPFFFPIPQQTVAITELESIKSVLKESERVLEKVESQEKSIVHEVTERAKDLREKEFKIPEPKPMHCSSDHEAWKQCYKENVENPLSCSGFVMRFQDCARRFRQQVSSEGK
ncbi:hypothetical protein HA466_0012400 [Hirschfeldia incana]|nr:hypothetical protein HA466_0012400 [Hirschfeldia incana]